MDKRNCYFACGVPMRFVQRLRVQTAVQLLETTTDPVERIARKVGLASPSSLYRLVMKHTGRSPLGHRAAWPRV